MRRRLSRRCAALALTGVLLCSGCTTPTVTATPTASVDEPQALTSAQADALAAVPFKNYMAGITSFTGQLFGGEAGDMQLAGWIDHANGIGYAIVSPVGAPKILVAWDQGEVAYLDLIDATGTREMPPPVPPEGAWQRVAFDSEASDLTRMLAALLMLSSDRPDNAALLKQNGARYLGTETIAGELTHRFSGVATEGAQVDGADLGTQYWLDADGALVRFGMRIAGTSLSIIDFREGDGAPERLLPPASIVTGAASSG